MQEAILLHAKRRSIDIEQMRLNLIIKSIMLDRTNADEVLKYNSYLEEYWTLLIPEFKTTQKEKVKDKAELLKEFSNDFKQRFKTGKFKNFKKAK